MRSGWTCQHLGKVSLVNKSVNGSSILLAGKAKQGNHCCFIGLLIPKMCAMKSFGGINSSYIYGWRCFHRYPYLNFSFLESTSLLHYFYPPGIPLYTHTHCMTEYFCQSPFHTILNVGHHSESEWQWKHYWVKRGGRCWCKLPPALTLDISKAHIIAHLSFLLSSLSTTRLGNIPVRINRAKVSHMCSSTTSTVKVGKLAATKTAPLIAKVPPFAHLGLW